MEFEEGEQDGVDLGCELSGRGYDDGVDVVSLRGFVEAQEFVDEGDEEGKGLSTACDSLGYKLVYDLGRKVSAVLTSTTTSLLPMKCGIVAV